MEFFLADQDSHMNQQVNTLPLLWQQFLAIYSKNEKDPQFIHNNDTFQKNWQIIWRSYMMIHICFVKGMSIFF